MARSGAVGALVVAAHTAVNAWLLRNPAGSAPVRERVSVVLPVRDEADRVHTCLTALLASRDVADLEVLVYDDQSSDGTDTIVRKLAAEDPRLRVLTGPEPEPGWLGKPHACARAAREATGTVIVFVDADVTVAPHGVARAVGLLRGAGLDLVSPYPRQVAVSVPERLVQPLLQWSWLALLPLRAAERSARPSLTAANGQFLCVDAAAYARAGGHAAVRGAVLDDLALLRAVKRSGGRGVVADGTDLATTWMYDGWAPLRDGYAKSLWAAGGNPAASLGQLAGLAWLFVVPAVAALRGSRLGLVGYLAGVAGRVVAARRTGSRSWPDALAHPVSVGLLGQLTALSWWRRRRGTARWKGRLLDGPDHRTPAGRALDRPRRALTGLDGP
ncbi:glycosyltransferase family 2 protein [Parafrankia sp. EUN1f]|uniref:glycosyltransferase n=1 Tax=Parafrankia sp. EUN1f TaxID=102897 RepID=UPI0001C4433A|nr:glycosyltransferase family 2 protein [Parafrankia sp. EUN1f]EFC83804.1 glycosyl transferase family 2 [Parafrankia sp. EUN1f]